jgi:hypothetical protein
LGLSRRKQTGDLVKRYDAEDQGGIVVAGGGHVSISTLNATGNDAQK